MSKLAIAALVAAAGAAGFVAAKVIKEKKKASENEFFEENYNEDCFDCEENLDVVVPAEETEDAAEEIKEADAEPETIADETAED